MGTWSMSSTYRATSTRLQYGVNTFMSNEQKRDLHAMIDQIDREIKELDALTEQVRAQTREMQAVREQTKVSPPLTNSDKRVNE